MKIRFLIVVFCYLFSSIGIFFTFQISFEELKHFRPSNIIVLIWCVSWGLHLLMSVFWVLNKKVSSLTAKIALMSLAIALLYMPLRGLIMTSGIPLLGIIGMAFTFVLEVLFVLPVFILAIHLFRFNLKSEKVVS